MILAVGKPPPETRGAEERLRAGGGGGWLRAGRRVAKAPGMNGFRRQWRASLGKKFRQRRRDFARCPNRVECEARARALEKVSQREKRRRPSHEIGGRANRARSRIRASRRLDQQNGPRRGFRKIVNDHAHIEPRPPRPKSENRPQQAAALVDSVESSRDQPEISPRQRRGRGHSLGRRNVSGKSPHEVASEFLLEVVFESREIGRAAVDAKTGIVKGRGLDENSRWSLLGGTRCKKFALLDAHRRARTRQGKQQENEQPTSHRENDPFLLEGENEDVHEKKVHGIPLRCVNAFRRCEPDHDVPLRRAGGHDLHRAALLFKMHNYQKVSMGFAMRMHKFVGREPASTGAAPRAHVHRLHCARLSVDARSDPRAGFLPFVAMEVF